MNKKYVCIEDYESGDCVVGKNQEVELVGYVLGGKTPCISLGGVQAFTIDQKKFDKHFNLYEPWKTQEEYLKSPHKCPKCGSEEIVVNYDHIDKTEAIQDVSCLSCRAEWRGVYKLVKYEKKGE